MVEKIALPLRILASAIFVYFGVMKLMDINEYYAAVINYQIVEGNLALAVTYYLPTVEILLAVFFLADRFKLSAGTGLIILLVIFEIAMLSALMRGMDINCGCAAKGTTGLTWPLIRNLLFFALIWFGMRGKREDEDPGSADRSVGPSQLCE